jgi:N-acylneuraminate cytidylyltransferase/CMP-N,N'-diacetyllegionaminic acid synthase
MTLCGKPLLGWPIAAAAGSKYVDKVIVSTDSQHFADIAKAEGAEVPFLRPAELAADNSTSFLFLKHALDFFEAEQFKYCVLLEPTSPLTDSDDIDSALEQLDQMSNSSDSIIGVSKLEATHPDFNVTVNSDGHIRSWCSDGFSSAGRRQDLKDIFFFEGSLYISKVSALLSNEGFYHDKTLPYVVPKWKSFEIDDFTDFVCIEAIMKNLSKIKEMS